ncbi:MAG: type II toxin-antitoxin system RatA family toxin [Nitrosomonas sp.]
MAEIEKSVIVEYSAEQMFVLVDNVADYPKFLPWCGGASVVVQDNVTAHATVEINYHQIRHSFTTVNKRYPVNMPASNKEGKDALIEMNLLDGPFEQLEGYWHFISLGNTSLGDTACKINFRLRYTFSSKILEKLFGPVFHMIANNFVESFIKRAEEIYGTPS